MKSRELTCFFFAPLCTKINLKIGGYKMKFILSVFYLLVFSSLMAFGLDLTPTQAGISTVGLSVVYSSVKSLSGWSVPGLAMEFVTDLTGVTDKSGLRIFKPIAGIGCAVDGLLTTEKIKVDLVNSVSGKSKQIVPFMTLKRLFELSSQAEGCWKNTATDTFGVFDITPDGTAYAMEQGDYFTVELTALIAGRKYDFFGIESPVKGSKLLKYDYYTIPAGEYNKSYGVKGALYFGVSEWKLDRIKVKGQNFSTEFKRKELEIMAYRSNDVTDERSASVMSSDGVTPVTIYYPNAGSAGYMMIMSRYQKSAFEIGTLEEIEVITDGTDVNDHVIVWEQ